GHRSGRGAGPDPVRPGARGGPARGGGCGDRRIRRRRTEDRVSRADTARDRRLRRLAGPRPGGRPRAPRPTWAPGRGQSRAAFAEGLASGTEVLYVTLEVSFDEALRRALDDPTRGRSRDPFFLRRYFAAAGHGLDTAHETDLVLDTQRMSAAAAAESIASLV